MQEQRSLLRVLMANVCVRGLYCLHCRSILAYSAAPELLNIVAALHDCHEADHIGRRDERQPGVDSNTELIRCRQPILNRSN
jgi:hypothetical protein